MAFKSRPVGLLTWFLVFAALGVTFSALPFVLKGDSWADLVSEPQKMLDGIKLFYIAVGSALLTLGIAYVAVDKEDPVRTRPGDE
ncbi:MAG: hypothetical protein VKK59_04545 [Vampirovibrionales bacterium]|nr:hypothetical protein [Vampirovibrionales bacterium]